MQLDAETFTRELGYPTRLEPALDADQEEGRELTKVTADLPGGNHGCFVIDLGRAARFYAPDLFAMMRDQLRHYLSQDETDGGRVAG